MWFRTRYFMLVTILMLLGLQMLSCEEVHFTVLLFVPLVSGGAKCDVFEPEVSMHFPCHSFVNFEFSVQPLNCCTHPSAQLRV